VFDTDLANEVLESVESVIGSASTSASFSLIEDSVVLNNYTRYWYSAKHSDEESEDHPRKKGASLWWRPPKTWRYDVCSEASGDVFWNGAVEDKIARMRVAEVINEGLLISNSKLPKEDSSSLPHNGCETECCGEEMIQSLETPDQNDENDEIDLQQEVLTSRDVFVMSAMEGFGWMNSVRKWNDVAAISELDKIAVVNVRYGCHIVQPVSSL